MVFDLFHFSLFQYNLNVKIKVFCLFFLNHWVIDWSKWITINFFVALKRFALPLGHPYKGKKNPIWNEANFYYFTCLKWVSACLAARGCSQSLVPEGWEYMKSVVFLVSVVLFMAHIYSESVKFHFWARPAWLSCCCASHY